MQVDLSVKKKKKKKIADGLAMGGQMDSQFGKSTQVAKRRKTFTHKQMICDQLVSTFIGWPNGERLALTCVRI